jgi:cytochrome c1
MITNETLTSPSSCGNQNTKSNSKEKKKSNSNGREILITKNLLGEMYQRPGLVGDAIPKAYPNEQAARYSNGGANPPDLSTFVKSHHNGADYVN